MILGTFKMESLNHLTQNYFLSKIIMYLTDCGYPLLGFLKYLVWGCPDVKLNNAEFHDQFFFIISNKKQGCSWISWVYFIRNNSKWISKKTIASNFMEKYWKRLLGFIFELINAWTNAILIGFAVVAQMHIKNLIFLFIG